MLKNTAVSSLAAVAAAALVAGLVVSPAAIVPPANAEPAALARVVPTDTLIGDGPCSLQGWPYYERSCYFDLRTPGTEMGHVRVIALR